MDPPRPQCFLERFHEVVEGVASSSPSHGAVEVQCAGNKRFANHCIRYTSVDLQSNAVISIWSNSLTGEIST